MNRTEHLLTILSEECNETAQRVSKALRFGLGEIQTTQELSNADRIIYEFNDIVAVMEILKEEGLLKNVIDREAIEKKKLKVEQFLKYSKACGTVDTANTEESTKIKCLFFPIGKESLIINKKLYINVITLMNRTFDGSSLFYEYTTNKQTHRIPLSSGETYKNCNFIKFSPPLLVSNGKIVLSNSKIEDTIEILCDNE